VSQSTSIKTPGFHGGSGGEIGFGCEEEICSED
jgi:hypothetical protein